MIIVNIEKGIPMTISAMVREELDRLGFTEDELGRITEFLTPFCGTARIYFLRIFERTRVRKKTFEETMYACLRAKQRMFICSSEGRLGDPDDPRVLFAPGNSIPSCTGIENIRSFCRAYLDLGLPFPKFLFYFE